LAIGTKYHVLHKMPFDELRANGRLQVSLWFDKLTMIGTPPPFVVSLSNHAQSIKVKRFSR